MKYLEKIALKLKKNKVIGSREGVLGGYFLEIKSSKISLDKIIKAVEGKKGLVRCIYGNCSFEDRCLHKKVWQKLQTAIINEFKKIYLSDFTIN